MIQPAAAYAGCVLFGQPHPTSPPALPPDTAVCRVTRPALFKAGSKANVTQALRWVSSDVKTVGSDLSHRRFAMPVARGRGTYRA